MERKKRTGITVHVDERVLLEAIYVLQNGRAGRYEEMSDEQIQRYFVATFRFVPEVVRTRKLIDACRDSTRLTVEDYLTYINI